MKTYEKTGAVITGLKLAVMLAILMGGCVATLGGPGAQEPPPADPVTCEGHDWTDEDGVPYRLPVTNVWVDNASGYPLDLSTLGGSSLSFSPTERSGDFHTPMMRVDEPGNGWLGKAWIWMRGNIITRTKVLMNEGYEVMSEPIIHTRVGCMEVLHTAGFGHQDGEDSCMNDCAGASDWLACMRNPKAQTPDRHDFEQMAIAYGEKAPPPNCVSASLEERLVIFEFPVPDGIK